MSSDVIYAVTYWDVDGHAVLSMVTHDEEQAKHQVWSLHFRGVLDASYEEHQPGEVISEP